jgi:hypothetical protein
LPKLFYLNDPQIEKGGFLFTCDSNDGVIFDVKYKALPIIGGWWDDTEQESYATVIENKRITDPTVIRIPGTGDIIMYVSIEDLGLCFMKALDI